MFRYLLSNQARRSVTDLMPMIGARFYTQLDAAQFCSDVLENELTKELENGRLFRLIVKLATINERPELNLDSQWSETGDRYMLKLFRDYVFHQVTADGKPWLDLAHVVSCLNKLDVGAPDKVSSYAF
jgi:PAB-dependent poly(A)-specific ribonuclease subunit 3